ncbi:MULTISPECIES: hypothetical protein [unclassified Saccharothrix]|uniref:hypothetical protein n=1 Tax=unclassified Saccharothrix TaxID=2593673 RepID=UPI00307DC667
MGAFAAATAAQALSHDSEGDVVVPVAVGVISVSVAVGAMLVALIVGRRLNRQAGRFPVMTPAGRIEQARDHLDSTARLLRQLEDELTTLTRVLEQRQVDADRYQRLAMLNADQAKLVEHLVARQFERQTRTTWRLQGFQITTAFLLGLVVNWISQPALYWLSSFWT